MKTNSTHAICACLSVMFVGASITVLAQTNKPKASSKQEWVDAIPDGTPHCIANAPAGYNSKACMVVVNRDEPISPAAINVPGGTTVYIRLDNPRWDEFTTFNSTVSQTLPLNLPVDALTSLASPLSNLQGAFRSLVLSQQKGVSILDYQPNPSPPTSTSWQQRAEALKAQGDAIIGLLRDVTDKIQVAGIRFTCVENYRAFDPARNSCNYTEPLTRTTVGQSITDANGVSATAAALSVPSNKITDLGTDITTFATNCNTITTQEAKEDCLKASDLLQAIESGISATVKDIQAAQDGLRQAQQQIAALNRIGPPNHLYFSIREPFLRNSTVTIMGTEVVTKSATTIGTVTVNWQQSGFILSTGLMGSGLANKTYAMSSIIRNQVVQTDPMTGKNLSIVTATSVGPAMDFPTVFGSWVVPWINRAKWENRCPGHCSFLLSGGAALNLTSKTADLAIGPSVELWGILVTPSLVWGRQSILSNGITVGYTGFGINPPSSLQTQTVWKKGFGIALTYALPTP